MTNIQKFNLVLRGLLEAGIVAGLGYYGYMTGENTGMRIFLVFAFPIAGFGFWGMVDFHRFGKYAETLRLIQELLISGLAAFALYRVNALIAGWCLGVLSLVYHYLVYASGNTLLKKRK